MSAAIAKCAFEPGQDLPPPPTFSSADPEPGRDVPSPMPVQDLPSPMPSSADQQDRGQKRPRECHPKRDDKYKIKYTRLKRAHKSLRKLAEETSNHNALLEALAQPGTLEKGYKQLRKYKSYKKMAKEHKVSERRNEHLRFMLERSKEINTDLRKKFRKLMGLYGTLKEENQFLEDDIWDADNALRAEMESDEEDLFKGDWRHATVPNGKERDGDDWKKQGTRRRRELKAGFDADVLPPHPGKRPPKRNEDDSSDWTPSEEWTGESENYEDSDDREYQSDGFDGEAGAWASGSYVR